MLFFYSSDKLQYLLNNKQEDKALIFLKKVIFLEKRWRYGQCLKLFPVSTCRHLNTQPFSLWAKAAASHVTRDPTSDIKERLMEMLTSL